MVCGPACGFALVGVGAEMTQLPMDIVPGQRKRNAWLDAAMAAVIGKVFLETRNGPVKAPQVRQLDTPVTCSSRTRPALDASSTVGR